MNMAGLLIAGLIVEALTVSGLLFLYFRTVRRIRQKAANGKGLESDNEGA